METSPYMCFCAAGIKNWKESECEWHNALMAAARAMDDVDLAPSWYKENENEVFDDAVKSIAGTDPSDREGGPGGGAAPPNCT